MIRPVHKDVAVPDKALVTRDVTWCAMIADVPSKTTKYRSWQGDTEWKERI